MLVQDVGVVNVWLPGRCRWLGIFWCKTICRFDFDMVLSHLPIWLLCCIGSGILKVVNVWWPVWCRWLSIFWCKVIFSSEFDVVPSHLQPLLWMLYGQICYGCWCLTAWVVQMAWHILMQGHVQRGVWCGTKPFTAIDSWMPYSGPVCWGMWLFGGLVGADGLAYSYLIQGHLEVWA